LKKVLADVLTKKNWTDQVRCFPSTQKGEKTEKNGLTTPPCGRAYKHNNAIALT